MAATRPIQREVSSTDRNAAWGLAVHNSRGIYLGPDASPGVLITQPDLAGTQVKAPVGGGFFNPRSKTSKFK